jgi:DNA-binding GntR family transcriptional regulator
MQHSTQPFAADDTGESDLEYFTARPHARHRIRAAFPNEFSDELLKPGGGRPAVVIVAIERDENGRPTTRGRGLVFPEGGTA